MKTILFQGDSITDAGRDREEERIMGDGYALRVSGALGLQYPGAYRFINRGVSGDRIVDIYRRIKVDAINWKPDIMSLLVGVNDVAHENVHSNGVDAEKFGKIYELIIQELFQALPDLKLMLLEPFVLKTEQTEPWWPDYYEQVRLRGQKVEMLAKQYGLVFVPLQKPLEQALELAPANYWLRDGVHPSQAGAELIKREWIKGFEKLTAGKL